MFTFENEFAYTCTYMNVHAYTYTRKIGSPRGAGPMSKCPCPNVQEYKFPSLKCPNGASASHPLACCKRECLKFMKDVWWFDFWMKCNLYVVLLNGFFFLYESLGDNLVDGLPRAAHVYTWIPTERHVHGSTGHMQKPGVKALLTWARNEHSLHCCK